MRTTRDVSLLSAIEKTPPSYFFTAHIVTLLSTIRLLAPSWLNQFRLDRSSATCYTPHARASFLHIRETFLTNQAARATFCCAIDHGGAGGGASCRGPGLLLQCKLFVQLLRMRDNSRR